MKFFSRFILTPIIGRLFGLVEALREGPLRDVDFVQNKRKSIFLARKDRALISTAEYVERNMPHVESVVTRPEILKRAFERADVSGDRLICEFGVWKGTSINRLAKLTAKTIYGFDAFEGLPEAFGDFWKKEEFRVSKLPAVRNNITLVKGWFNETLPSFLKEHSGQVGFLHIDCDLYSSTKTIFELMESRLSPGTVILFDEYFNFILWEEAEFKAFHEFLAKTGLSFDFIGYNRNGEQVAVILK